MKKNLITLINDISELSQGVVCTYLTTDCFLKFPQTQGILEQTLSMGITLGLSYWAIRSYKELCQNLKNSD